MPRITPVEPRELVRVFELDGWQVKRQRGSHIAMVKEGCLRPVIIPDHSSDVPRHVILSNLRTAEMSRERYFELLEQAR